MTMTDLLAIAGAMITIISVFMPNEQKIPALLVAIVIMLFAIYDKVRDK